MNSLGGSQPDYLRPVKHPDSIFRGDNLYAPISAHCDGRSAKATSAAGIGAKRGEDPTPRLSAAVYQEYVLP